MPEKSLSEGCEEPESRFCGRVESCLRVKLKSHRVARQANRSVHAWMDARVNMCLAPDSYVSVSACMHSYMLRSCGPALLTAPGLDPIMPVA